jgi:hypothetical protein
MEIEGVAPLLVAEGGLRGFQREEPNRPGVPSLRPLCRQSGQSMDLYGSSRKFLKRYRHLRGANLLDGDDLAGGV